MIKRVAVVTAVYLSLWMVNAASADESTQDPKSIVAAAQIALKKVQLVRYEVEALGEGWVARFVPPTTATVLVGKRMKYDIDQFRCDAEIKTPDSEDVQRFSAGCDGDNYYLIDPKAKIAYEDMDPAVMGSQSRQIQRPVLGEFAEPEPLADLLEEGEIKYAGTADIAGEPCHLVAIHTPDDRPKETIWAFSKNDHLPRQIKRVYAPREEGGEDGITLMTLSKVEVNPNVDGDPFKLRVPEGFKKTSEFAP